MQNNKKRATTKPKQPKKTTRNKAVKRLRNGKPKNRPLTAHQNTRVGERPTKSSTVVQDEYVGEISGSIAFNVTSYPINPGQPSTFIWLAAQAKQWEKYTFNYLKFYYKHEVSEFAVNGTTGKVILGVDFDASDPAPSTKQQIEDTDPRVDDMPCKDLYLNLPSSKIHALYKTLFVRTGGLPGSSDIKTYDAGVLHVATQGNQNTSIIGELRVKYSVTFSVPVLENINAPHRNYNSSAYQVSVGTVLTSGSARTIPVVTIMEGLGAVNALGAITLPVGRYLVSGTTEINADTTTLVTAYSTGIYKNGSLVYQQNNLNGGWPAGVILSISPSPAIIESDGTDTVEMKATATFSTSTCTAIGSLIILAI